MIFYVVVVCLFIGTQKKVSPLCPRWFTKVREPLINDVYKRKDRLPEYERFPVKVSPYSNRGERIGAHVSEYEREREIIEYTYVINKEKRRKVLLRPDSCFFLERI